MNSVYIDIVIAVTALGGLGLGIFNYWQARRRDVYEIRATTIHRYSEDKDGIRWPVAIDVHVINVGQRPVTITGAALVFRQGLLPLGRTEEQVVYPFLKSKKLRLEENHPHLLSWRWVDVKDKLERTDIISPSLATILLAVGEGKLIKVRPKWRHNITEVVRSIMSKELLVDPNL